MFQNIEQLRDVCRATYDQAAISSDHDKTSECPRTEEVIYERKHNFYARQHVML